MSTEIGGEADAPVSFELDIKPMFRDRQAMRFRFDLWSSEDVSAHAAAVLTRLRDGTMPCDGAWQPAQIDLFERWTEGGTQP